MKLFGNHKSAIAVSICALCFCLPVMAEGVKPLEKYPLVDRLWLGMEEGTVRPAGYEQVRSNSEGFLELLVADGAALKKGQKWGILNPRQLELDKKNLVIDEQKLVRELENARQSNQEARVALSVELHELMQKGAVLEDVVNDPEISKTLKARAAEAIESINEQMAMIQVKLEPQRMKQDLKLKIDELELQLERQRNQLVLLEKRSELKAGFDGELRLADELRNELKGNQEKGPKIWLTSNQHIGTVTNESSYEIVVMSAGPGMSMVPAEELVALLQDGRSGQLLTGIFTRLEEVDRGSEITRNYIFTIQEKSLANAKAAMGQVNMVHIYRKFDKPFHLVQKKDIAFSAPEVLAAGGWNVLVRHLWKGAEVIQVGPQSIAVKHHEN